MPFNFLGSRRPRSQSASKSESDLRKTYTPPRSVYNDLVAAHSGITTRNTAINTPPSPFDISPYQSIGPSGLSPPPTKSPSPSFEASRVFVPVSKISPVTSTSGQGISGKAPESLLSLTKFRSITQDVDDPFTNTTGLHRRSASVGDLSYYVNDRNFKYEGLHHVASDSFSGVEHMPQHLAQSNVVYHDHPFSEEYTQGESRYKLGVPTERDLVLEAPVQYDFGHIEEQTQDEVYGDQGFDNKPSDENADEALYNSFLQKFHNDSIGDGYENMDEYETDIEVMMDGGLAAPYDDGVGDSSLVKVPTRSVPNSPLGDNWAWSPACSDDGNAADALDYVAPLSISPKTPRKAPESSLPMGPPPHFQGKDFQRGRDDSLEYAPSPDSYGNTRALLELATPTNGHRRHGDEGLAHVANSPSSAYAKTPLPNFSFPRGMEKPYARLSVLSSDGSSRSRHLSHIETQTLEQQIAAHLRQPSGTQEPDRPSGALGHYEGYECEARISIEYHSANDNLPVNVGPGGSQTTSSMSAMRAGNGTPPLLFGKRGIFTFDESLSAVANNNIPGDSLVEAIEGDDNADWETVAGSQNLKAATGSSLADNSDSEGLSPPKWTPIASRAQVLQHPAHSRYTRSYNLLKDKQSGDIVLMPEYTFTGGVGFPNNNVVTPPAVSRMNSFPYQHPAPLSKEHSHPFNSSPPGMRSERPSLQDRSEYIILARNRSALNQNTIDVQSSPSQHEGSDMHANNGSQSISCESGLGDPVIKDGQQDLSFAAFNFGGVGAAYPSSAWLSTADEMPSEDYRETPGRHGSFSKMTMLGPRANVTGTPQGTDAREVGSSLANASSPIAKVVSSPGQAASSPFTQLAPFEGSGSQTQTSTPAKISHRHTHDGSVESSEANSPGNFYDCVRARALDYDSEYFDEDGFLTTFPSAVINSSDIIKHRQHLIENSLLPKALTPPPQEPKRMSVPLEYITQTTSPTVVKEVGGKSTGATGASVGQTSVQSAVSSPGHHMRMRSPIRRKHGYALASHALENLEGQNLSSEFATNFAYNETDPIANATSATTNNGSKTLKKQGKDKNSDADSDEFEMLDLRVDPELAQNLQRVRTWDSARRLRAPRPAHQQNVDPNRPVARAESPHLYRVPRPKTDALRTREKELSIMFFALSFILPFLLPLYGFGNLDGVMRSLSRGDIDGFREQEKKAARVITYTVMCLLVMASIALVIVWLVLE
ncbi:hypothetical protein MMC12_001338 [Toensbergia leucococca]|nr:hypothetical protein [Toensbergia leucococca]